MSGSAERVGWIGTGRLGAEIVRRLLALGTEVVVCNRTADKSGSLVAAGARVESKPRDVAEASASVYLCLSGAEAAEWALYAADHGICAAKRRPLCVVDTSTVGAGAALSHRQRLARHDVSYVEAPVSGGPEGARKGDLVALLAGDREHIERERTTVRKFAAVIHGLGTPGSAQALKIANNLAESANLWGAAEAVELGLRAGVTLEALRGVLPTMRGHSRYMDVLFERLSNPEAPATASLEVRTKDLRLALAAASELALPVPLTRHVAGLFEAALRSLGNRADQADCIALLREARSAEP